MKKYTKREFDFGQLSAINAMKNSVVSAGAGSGKTTVLAERFTKLVKENGFCVDEILTLTFTKKATVEMSERIYGTLKNEAPEAALDFYKANIKTLDAYCASIAKMGAHYYGLSPDFVQDSEAILSHVREIVLPFLLSRIDEPVIRLLVGTKDFVSTAENLFVKPLLENSSVCRPIDFKKGVELQKKEICNVWNERTSSLKDAVASLRAAYNDFSGNRESSCIKKLDELFQKDFPELFCLTERTIESSDCSSCDAWIKNATPFLNVSLPGNLKNSELIKKAVLEIRNFKGKFSEISSYIKTYKILLATVPYYEDFQNRINSYKRSSGNLTFKDIAELAYCILRDYPEIRQVEKEKYKAIMIDEFQDNNSLQRDMLFMLAEKLERKEKGIPSVEELSPDKLFFVGDEKQSIYLFRGADVSVFRSLSDDFKDGKLSMDTNYRSCQALIACFNTIFGGFPYPPNDETNLLDETDLLEKSPSVFYTERKNSSPSSKNGDVPDYEAVYHEVSLSKKAEKEIRDAKTPMDFYAPHLHFALFDADKKLDDSVLLVGEEAEAEWVCRKINEIVTDGVLGKNYSYSDIAVLFRNYATQNIFERAMLNHGIPYNTEIVKGFFSDGPVNDIFAYLRICVYPNDTMSYAQVLCSPFVNLSFDEAAGVLLSEEEPFSLEDFSILSDEAKKRFLHAKDFFLDIKDSLKTLEISEIITKLWYEGGYRFEVMWNESLEMYAKMYDMIFDLAKKAEERNEGLSAFVDGVKFYKKDDSKLEGMDIPMEKVSGVNILSIHKSKGLEYPVVFVCSTHKSSADERNSDFVYFDKNFGISINSESATKKKSSENYFFAKMKSEQNLKETAELRRLVYVAMTRASDHLFVTNGKYSMSSDAEKKYSPAEENAADSVFHILEPFFNFYNDDLYDGTKPFDVEKIPAFQRISDKSDGKRKNLFSEKEKLFSVLADEKPYEKAASVKMERPDSIYENPSKIFQEENVFSASADSSAPYQEINVIVEKSDFGFGYNNFGTIAHAYMEASVNEKTPVYPNREIIGLKDYEKDKAEIERICLEMKENFSNSELGKKAMEAKRNGFCKTEYSFKSRNGSKIVKGVIDLLFKDKDGSYVIVDFKTNQTKNPEIYYVQLSYYRKAVAYMFGVKDFSKIKCFLYYLRFSEAVDISEHCDIMPEVL